MTYDIIATGSSGNAVVINGEILIDCGAPMKKLRESGYIKDLKLVLLTHEHGDHFKPATVRALHKERPTLRWGCCEWMVPKLLEAGVDARVIILQKPGERWHYPKIGAALAESIPHDVQNCFWHIAIGGEFSFYATDTSTLDHIEAKGYDLYLIEARIAEKQARGEFAYETRAAQNHLSQEQAFDWLARNAGPNSRYVFLHQHKEAGNGLETPRHHHRR